MSGGERWILADELRNLSMTERPGNLGLSTLAAFNATDTRQIRVRSRMLVGTTDCSANSPRIFYIS